MTVLNEAKSSARTPLWLSIVATACILSFLLGYVVSAKTGVEPGFFERPEAGGYGVSAEKSGPSDLDKDLQEYYNDLNN